MRLLDWTRKTGGRGASLRCFAGRLQISKGRYLDQPCGGGLELDISMDSSVPEYPRSGHIQRRLQASVHAGVNKNVLSALSAEKA